MNDFINSIKKRDPAANSTLSVILTYPGVKAVFFHKVANFFHVAGFQLLARIISQSQPFIHHNHSCVGFVESMSMQLYRVCVLLRYSQRHKE